MATALSINGLSKNYGSIRALNNLNLEVSAGDIFGILGPNGSGKTTTLGIVLSVLKPDSGSYEWFGGKYGNDHRKHIGAILETPNFYPFKSGIDNLKIVARIKGIKDENLNEIMKKVNLEQRMHSKFSTYSLGMKQRLAIAATMIGNPEVVIFDEPTNGLDPQGIAEVREILIRVAESGRTVIMASHILDEVEKICSHVAIIKSGQLLASGMVGELISDNYIIEINAFDQTKMKSFIESNSIFSKSNFNGKYWLCNIDKNLDSQVIAKLAYDQGLILNHFVIRKQSLEKEFLTITNDAK